MTTLRVLRNVANIANLSTPLGVLIGLAGTGRFRSHRGLIVVDRARLPLPHASAMTVGSVVLIPTESREEVEARMPGLISHEDEHAWQWALCMGLPFLPLYFAAAGWSLVRCGDRASANVFERQAGLALGGYPEQPKRSWGQMLALLRRGKSTVETPR